MREKGDRIEREKMRGRKREGEEDDRKRILDEQGKTN